MFISLICTLRSGKQWALLLPLADKETGAHHRCSVGVEPRLRTQVCPQLAGHTDGKPQIDRWTVNNKGGTAFGIQVSPLGHEGGLAVLALGWSGGFRGHGNNALDFVPPFHVG